MIVNSKYSKKFVSNSLTRKKYNELYNFALYLRDFKNKLSLEINNNLFCYLEFKPYDFSKLMRVKYKGLIPSSFDKQLHMQVLIAYQNKFNAIQRNLIFEKVNFYGFELYKKSTKISKKGDLKRVIINKSQTQLSICLSYLARYGNENTINYINEQIKQNNNKKKPLYDNILRLCDKFGFSRLYKLALNKRNRIIKYYQQKPIIFKSLSFCGRCRKNSIITYNSNYNSIINSFISLSGFRRKSFDIPVKFCKDYHGKINDYQKNLNDYEYIITFNEKQKQINLYLTKDGKRFIPEIDENSNVIGIDVNCKHNLLSLSNGVTYDYDRKLVNDLCKLSLQIDELKKQNKDYIVGKRKQQKLHKMREVMLRKQQQMIAEMCKTLQKQSINHIVMENLDNGFGKCYVKDKDNEDINYNRKVKFLKISSLKNEVEHIARKYEIAVSTVQPSYTSKMCPICGCIEDENRPNQETFTCIECGHTDNADFNAAKNIRNRVCVTVLRDKLLKQMDNGAYETKKLKREKVKEVLLSYHIELMKSREFI